MAARFRTGPRTYGPSKVPTNCNRGADCTWEGCVYRHPWNDNYPGFQASKWAYRDDNPRLDSSTGGYSPHSSSARPSFRPGVTRSDRVRPRPSDEYDDREVGAKRQRTDDWASNANYNASSDKESSSGTAYLSQATAPPQPTHTRFGTSSLDSPTSNNVFVVPSRNDPRTKSGPPPRGASNSPALNNSGFLSPSQTPPLGGGGTLDAMSFGTGVTGDARARDILVPEAGNIPLDQIRNPNEVLQFVIRRMAAAVRTNATREDLVAKHLVLKGLRQTIVPLPLSGQPNTSSKVEEQLDSSRREIHKVEQKLQRYYIEAEVGWRQLGLTFALGHLPSLAEVRDVEGVRVWIDGIKNDIGRYLEVRMQDDLRRAEARVVQAANAPRPRDDEMERRIFEISKAQEDIRIEQAKQRRLDNAGVLHRLEALEREMHDRRQMDADAHTEIESVTKRLTDLEDVFGYTRADLDTLIEKMDGMAAKEDRIDDVEKELRGIIDSAIASVPDKPTLITTILDRITPQLVNALQKHEAHYAHELKGLRMQMDERLAQVARNGGVNSTVFEDQPPSSPHESEEAME